MKKIFGILFALALVLGIWLVTAAPVLAGGVTPDRVTVITNAGDRLVDLQNDDGGFPWDAPGDGTSYTNIQGISAMGILKAWELDAKTEYETALAKAYDYCVDMPPTYTEVSGKWKETTLGVDSFPDITFLVWLSQAAAGDAGLLAEINTLQDPDITADDIASLAKERWDDRVNHLGATPPSEEGTATALAEYIRDARHSQGWDTLIPWDLETGVKAALVLDSYYPGQGYDQQAIDIAEVIYDSIDDAGNVYFNSTDTSQEDYVAGLTGGIEAFREASLHSDKAAELVTLLLAEQQSGGYWNYYGAVPATMSVQSTAYAIMALQDYDTESVTATWKAAAWLSANQKGDGGWYAEGGAGDEYAEIDSETGWALARLPAPVTLDGSGYYSIQAAIDAASAGDTIEVYPGTYDQEEANDRDLYNGGAGSTDLNIFVDKSVTIQGVDEDGNPITDADVAEAFIIPERDTPISNLCTIFIQADDVVITGLDVTAYDDPDYNFKTISVIGDNVTIMYCKLHARDQVSSIYMYDPRYDDDTDTSYIQSYTFEGNYLDAGGTSASGIRISSGPGWSGDVANRIIGGNTFDSGGYGIEFVGPLGDPWDVYPVGAATVTTNSFSGQDRGSVAAWGKYKDAQGYGDIDWDAIFNSNTFDKAVIVKTPGGEVRYYDAATFYYVRGIYSAIQRYPLNKVAQAGDTVMVADGTYHENVVIDKSLTLEAASAPVINGDTSGDGVPDGSCITVNSDGVTIDGFELTNGYNGIIGETSGSTIQNCIIHDNLNYVGSNGVGIVLWGDNDDNEILNNEIYNNDRQGIFIGYDDFDGDPNTTPKISTDNTISGNSIHDNGKYTQENGPDASAYGIQLWNADGNTIAANEIYNHEDFFPYGGTTYDFAQGIYLCASFDNAVTCNDLHDNNYGVGAWSTGRTPGSTNKVNRNNIVSNTGYGVRNYDATIDARDNWWGDASGPSGVGPGAGDAVSKYVLFYPWLHQEVVNCNPGYLLDHFKLYSASGAPINQPVYLEDQFHNESFAAMVGSPVFFGNPAEKWYDDTVTQIYNVNDHLTVYNLTNFGIGSQTWSVEVYNQFGSQNFTVSDPVMLAVPTQKLPYDPFVGPDHYLLYKVLDGKLLDVPVLLTDQFTSEEVMVLKPVYFANPVSKDGSPVEDPEAHLVFYQIVGAQYAGEVSIHNQFGMADLEVSNPALLAVPSDKVGFTTIADRIGIYRPSTYQFALDLDGNGLFNAAVDRKTGFGLSGDTPIIGDWNGDGKDEIGIYRPSTAQFALDMDGNGLFNVAVDRKTGFGSVGDKPIIGDWNGDGKDEIGIYRPTTSQFALDMDGNGLFNAAADRKTGFGLVGDIPIIGDWNADGKDDIGIYRPTTAQFALDMDGNGLFNAAADRKTGFGSVGDKPIIGDWNGDGKDEIGIYQPSTSQFALDMDGNGLFNAAVDRNTGFGLVGDTPIIGDWNADGKDEIGIYRPGTAQFALDMDGNGVFNGALDRKTGFGLVGDTPIIGRW
jgi:parallel beta-helix repeat protein